MWLRLRSIILAPEGEPELEPINPLPIVAIISLVGLVLISTALFF